MLLTAGVSPNNRRLSCILIKTLQRDTEKTYHLIRSIFLGYSHWSLAGRSPGFAKSINYTQKATQFIFSQMKHICTDKMIFIAD